MIVARIGQPPPVMHGVSFVHVLVLKLLTAWLSAIPVIGSVLIAVIVNPITFVCISELQSFLSAVMADGSRYDDHRCRECGSPFALNHGYCGDCLGDAPVVEYRPVQSVSADPFLSVVAECRGRDRRVELANESIQRMKRGGTASFASYLAAGPSIPLTPEGEREARALGLVHYKTSDTRPVAGRVSIEIDPLLARAQRLRKSVITSARLHDQETKKGGRRGAWYMLTLTYADGRSASPRDVSELLGRMRGFFNRLVTRARRFAGEVFRYLWVGELTQRGRPHYHVLIWVPRGIYFGKVDQRGWWPHGMSQIERARNAVGYLAKYASKFTSIVAGAFPKGFRTHGCGGLNTESKRELRWWKASVEARERLGKEADIRKCKGGWFDKLTGEFWASPWRVTLIGGRPIAWKIEEIPA